MKKIRIYHNPRCSKSRQTLQLLNDRGVEPEVVEYLKDPPDAATIETLIDALGIEAHDLLRSKEAPYKELGLAAKKDDAPALIRAMTENPILIERPIVVVGERARIGRPPQDILEIL